MKNKELDVEVLDAVKAREIVQEILNFGVNELQKKKIIKMLSLELEDRETMIKICSAIDGEQEKKLEL